MKTFLLEIRTPDKCVLRKNVEFLAVPAYEGQLGVLPGHINCIARLRSGKVRFRAEHGSHSVIISEGYMEVLPDRATVLAESAEPWVDIPE